MSEDREETQKERAELKKGYLLLLLRLALIALIALLIFTKVFLITRVTGNEMFPALKDGDLLLAFRPQRSYGKNDVVIYTRDGERAIGRIAAVEGDVVMSDESGTLLVNGTEQSGERVYPGDALTYPYRVPQGSVFLLADRESTAHDSREIGAIGVEKIEGRVITLLRRRGL